MAYFPPDTPITFEYGGAYTPPLPSVVVFGFSSDSTRAIPEPADISVEISDATVSISYSVDGDNVQIPVIASDSVIESFFVIDSANAIIEAAISESEIFKQHSVRSDDVIIGVEITESITSESNSYIFHFFAYTPPSVGDNVNFTYGESSADFRVASEYLTVSMDVETSVVDISVGINSEDSEISFSSTASIIEFVEGIISENISVTGSVLESNIEDYHDISLPDINLAFNIPTSTIEEYHSIESVGIGIAAQLIPSVIENVHIISSNNVNVDIGISGLDIDGNISTDFNITKIPEIVSDDFNISMSAISTIGGGQLQNLPVSGKRYSSSWKNTEKTILSNRRTIWNEAITLDENSRIPFNTPEILDNNSNLEWIGIQDKEDENPRINWKVFENIPNRNINSAFTIVMEKEDIIKTSIEWDKFNTNHHTKNDIGYLIPEPKDKSGNYPWDSLFSVVDHKSMKYLQPSEMDLSHRTYWGPKWYSLYCSTVYFPPTFTEKPLMRFNGYDWEDQVEEGEDVWEFNDPRNFRCPWNYPYSGPRQPYNPPIVPGDSPLTVVPKGYYYIMNSTFIRRISGAMESIDFQSVSMSIDRDSWLWSFSITILSKESLNLIKPQGQAFTDIEINCNGWKWTCRVENWTETIVFGKKAWSVTGRSNSVELGQPYSIIPAFSNDYKQGGQIIDDVLSTSGSGWAAEWQNNDEFNPHLDWMVPAGVLNQTNTSLLKIMQAVSVSVGAFIQTTPDTDISTGSTGEQKLIIQPRYRLNPWNWGSITPDVYLNSSVCTQIGRQNNIKQPINGALVYGENQGVIINAVKDGTDGSNAAAVTSDALITSEEAGRERARHIIGNSGAWVNHTLKLFSLMPSGTAPGLLTPGNFISMAETGETTYIGQVTGTTINSGWGSNGLETSQSLEVEQYLGD